MADLTFGQRLGRQEASPSVCCWCGKHLKRIPTVDGLGWEPWLCWNDVPGPDGRSCWTRQLSFVITANDLDRRGKATGAFQWLFAPTPRQTEFAEQTRKTKFTGFGGAKAVAKSHGGRWLLYRDCLRIPNLRCLLLRRTFKELDTTHLLEMPLDAEKLKPMGANYATSAREMSFRANGSLIRAGHCETDGDVAHFLSTQWDRIVFDELVTFTRQQFLMIVSCARSTKQAVIDEGGAQVWAMTNPGGRGAGWVKELFIDQNPDPEQMPDYDASQWGFVQGWLEDNPYIESGYRQTLMNLPPILRRQWLDGDWNAYEGQFFDFQATKDRAPWHVYDAGIAD